MKKKFCLFLCLILCFSIMPSGEAKTEQAFFFGEDFEFVLLEDGTAQITKHLRLTDILTIPNELDGHIVTAIGDNAFCTCNDLVSVMLPNSIKSIGYQAFCDCSNLTYIKLSDNLNYIGDEAFSGCTGLTFITLPNSLKFIGNYAFSGCSGLTSIILPDSVTTIGDGAFAYCLGLSSVTLSNNLMTIGDGAFSGSDYLTTITLPDSITEIGSNPFSDCRKLREIHVSANHPTLATIDGALFRKREKQLVCYPAGKENCSYDVPKGIRVIGDSAFYGCSSLNSVSMPDTVTSIENRAFYSCTGLTSITLPNSITDIGANPFASCENLKSIKVSLEHPTLAIIDGVLFYKPEKRLVCYPASKENGSYIVPQGIRVIGDSAFLRCHNLNSISLPDSVMTIGNKAFYSCINLSFITLPTSLNVVGDSLFAFCRNLTSITLPDSLQIIESTAFFGCDALSSITVPEGVTSIGEMAFASCDSLISVTLPSSLTSIGDYVFERFDVPEKPAITVTRGSYAEQYCKDNLLKYTYFDSSDEVVIFFSDDIVAPANFEAVTDRIETTFSSSSNKIGNATVSLKKGFDFVNTDSSQFNLDLALTAVTCSAQVYSNASGDHTETILQNLDYETRIFKLEDSEDSEESGFMNPVVCFGYKKLDEGRNLFAAVIRGTDGFTDLLTDLADGAFSMFSNTGDNIRKGLEDFIKDSTGKKLEEIKKEDNYFFFTGHSLGGAIANYLSIENTIQEFVKYDKGKIYTYTFESPHTCINLLWMNPESMSNAFNYKVYGDAVTNLPNYPGSTTYGKDIIFKVSDLSNLTFKKLFVDSKESTLDDAVSVEGHGDIFGLHDICLELIYLMGEYDEYDTPHYVSGGGSGGWGDSGDDNSDTSNSPTHNNDPGEYTSGDYTYKLSQSGNVEIIKYNGHDSSVVVPASLDGHLVTAIGDDAFSYHSGKYGINYITLPDSITSIGNYAFSDCYINSITLPSNLKTLGDGAFSSCWPLTSITLPDSITEIGANPFYDCLSLESIRVSSSHPTLATIDGVLFYKPEKRLVCYPVSKKNSSYTVPQGIRVIGDNAFCNNFLKSVTLPDSVTAIGKEAFSACENLITVTFSDSVTAIGDNAFPNSPYLTITVPNESYGELYCKENRLSYKTYGSEATPTEEPISFHFKDDARQWYEPMVTFPVGYIEIYTNGNINDVKIVGCELSDESNIILAYYEEPANVEGDHLYHQFGISSIPDYAGIHYTLLPGANYKFREYVIYNGKKYYNGWIYFKMRDWLINGQ